jgi:hypothetical protein
MKKMQTKIIVNPQYAEHSSGPTLLRILLSKDYTKVDFGYQATAYYIKGGWVKIAKDTCILCKKTNKKYLMERAENIPVAPNRHHFNTIKDWLYYSLYFPPLDEKCTLIDLLEANPGKPNDFNYYNIKLDQKDWINVVE